MDRSGYFNFVIFNFFPDVNCLSFTEQYGTETLFSMHVFVLHCSKAVNTCLSMKSDSSELLSDSFDLFYIKTSKST